MRQRKTCCIFVGPKTGDGAKISSAAASQQARRHKPLIVGGRLPWCSGLARIGVKSAVSHIEFF